MQMTSNGPINNFERVQILSRIGHEIEGHLNFFVFIKDPIYNSKKKIVYV